MKTSEQTIICAGFTFLAIIFWWLGHCSETPLPGSEGSSIHGEQFFGGLAAMGAVITILCHFLTKEKVK